MLQSKTVSQGSKPSSNPQHAFKKQEPKFLQSVFVLHEAGANELWIGNSCKPMPMPSDALSLTKSVSAELTASHLVTLALPVVASSIEPD